QYDITFQYSADMQITATSANISQQRPQRQQLLGQFNGQPPPSSFVTADSKSTDNPELPKHTAFRRAEQNRVAQMAFRQRKQKYIKWSESKAEELDEVYRIMAFVRAENQQLCSLVMGLNAELSNFNRGATDNMTHQVHQTQWSVKTPVRTLDSKANAFEELTNLLEEKSPCDS
ncbi:hypothetical protein BGX20_000831, partial [Mortierella sp. AD010]